MRSCSCSCSCRVSLLKAFAVFLDFIVLYDRIVSMAIFLSSFDFVCYVHWPVVLEFGVSQGRGMCQPARPLSTFLDERQFSLFLSHQTVNQTTLTLMTSYFMP